MKTDQRTQTASPEDVDPAMMESSDDNKARAGAESAETQESVPVEELRAQAAKGREHWDQLVRLAADFENYKKRAAREKQDAIKYANEALLSKLIGVLDNFDMAVAAAVNSEDPAIKSLHTGVNMILAQLRNTLTEFGLEEIDATGQPFDPNLHEAISQQERADLPEGQVVQQTRRGFKLRDRLLRPASVIVSRKPVTVN